MAEETFIDCEFATYEVGDVVTIAGAFPSYLDATPHRYEITGVINARRVDPDGFVSKGRYSVRRIKDHMTATWTPWGNVTKSTAGSTRRLVVDAHTIPNTLTPRQMAAETKRIASFNWHPKGHPLRKATEQTK